MEVRRERGRLARYERKLVRAPSTQPKLLTTSK